MLLKSDAYDACLGYFADNLSVFEGKSGPTSAKLVSDVVMDHVADMLSTFFAQQTQLNNEVRLSVVAEGDRLLEDIEQVLGKNWEGHVTDEQQAFIDEYFILLKNSLDSQVHAL